VATAPDRRRHDLRAARYRADRVPDRDLRGLVEHNDIERLSVCGKILRDRQRAHHHARSKAREHGRDLAEKLAQREMARLLVHFVRERAPLRVSAEVRHRRQLTADPRSQDLLGKLPYPLVGRLEGLDQGVVLLGEEPAEDEVAIYDLFGAPFRVGVFEGWRDPVRRNDPGLDRVNERTARASRPSRAGRKNSRPSLLPRPETPKCAR
jgi:hypothetical protein